MPAQGPLDLGNTGWAHRIKRVRNGGCERELFEETGIAPLDLTAVADYDVDGVAGRLFTAEVRTRSALPAFEIAETIDCDGLPENLTYPEITPILLSAVTEWRSRP